MKAWKTTIGTPMSEPEAMLLLSLTWGGFLIFDFIFDFQGGHCIYGAQA